MMLALSAIRLDEATQVRAALNKVVVDEYAALMREGTVFPPVIVFRDALAYYMVDGFHRYRAAEQIGRAEIEADVREGSKADALWVALGANRTHGLRFTCRDVRRAVQLAITAFPERPCAALAAQIGCHASYATRVKRGMTTTSDRIVTAAGYTRLSSSAAFQKAKVEAEALLREGLPVPEIATRTGVGRETLHDLRRELGLGKDMTRAAIEARHAQMKQMADEGHSSRQIAAAVGLKEETCRDTLKKLGVVALGDRVTRGLHRHDSTRIVTRIVMDATNLTAGAEWIDFSDLAHAEIAGWLKSLKESRDSLSAFIRRLMQEQSHNGEAA